MTSKAGKSAPMANGTALKIFGCLTRGMPVEPIVRMGSGLQLSFLLVAFDTTERRIDLVMTDQAVGHMRKHRWTDFIRSVKSAMAGHACIRGVQVGA
jgi:hypothetical protein